jgi:hypothetical protein
MNGWTGYGINSGDYFMGDKTVEVLNYIVTGANINAVFEKHDVPKELDFLSIDIDSYDLSLW